MHGENVTRFWSEIMDQYESSGESSIDFVNGLDMPKNARGAVKAYIDDTPGARTEFGNPESWDWIVKNGDTDTSAMAAQKGGDLSEMSNFLATDDVPQTLFGIPVVSDGEQYTERDLAFFKEHPEAGGYYDMGDEPDDPSQGDENGGTSLDEMFDAKNDPPYDGSLDDLFEGKPLDPEVLG